MAAAEHPRALAELGDLLARPPGSGACRLARATVRALWSRSSPMPITVPRRSRAPVFASSALNA
ncbi:hypothetical protein ACIP5N_32820 [Streptomyces sp. NPDC088768]|uniref:hypothetical protein n=1 Tax=Streptomyces sp. NPDC088768 TaxID=3365894 RepID=UPI0038007E81